MTTHTIRTAQELAIDAIRMVAEADGEEDYDAEADPEQKRIVLLRGLRQLAGSRFAEELAEV